MAQQRSWALACNVPLGRLEACVGYALSVGHSHGLDDAARSNGVGEDPAARHQGLARTGKAPQAASLTAPKGYTLSATVLPRSSALQPS